MQPVPRQNHVRSATGWVVLCSVIACAGGSWAAEPGDWRRDALWDDGRAEFATYEVEWPRYGHTYRGRTVLVLVKEPWAPDLDVKADTPRKDGFDVLKLNHLRDVPTGMYTYHQAASIIVRRDNGALVKVTSSSAEACGVTSAQWRDGVLHTQSYFDGQGDRRIDWPRAAWPQEALPVVLRQHVEAVVAARAAGGAAGDLAGGGERGAEAAGAIEVFTPLLASRLGELAAQTWQVQRRYVGQEQVPAGSFDAVAVELRRGDARMTFVFDAALPHALLRYEDTAGTVYRLARIERVAYWRHHDPGDETWYPEGLREEFGR